MNPQKAPAKKSHRERPNDRPRGRPSLAEAQAISYLDPESLRRFLTERGKIKSRSQTGLNARDQARLARAVKRAREIAPLPYVTESKSPKR